MLVTWLLRFPEKERKAVIMMASQKNLPTAAGACVCVRTLRFSSMRHMLPVASEDTVCPGKLSAGNGSRHDCRMVSLGHTLDDR